MKFTSILKSNRGFTLIESTVTLALIAALAAFSIGPVSGYIKDAEAAAVQLEASQLRDALQILQIYGLAGENDLLQKNNMPTAKGYSRLRELAGLDECDYPNGFINKIALNGTGGIIELSYFSPNANDIVSWQQAAISRPDS